MQLFYGIVLLVIGTIMCAYSNVFEFYDSTIKAVLGVIVKNIVRKLGVFVVFLGVVLVLNFVLC